MVRHKSRGGNEKETTALIPEEFFPRSMYLQPRPTYFPWHEITMGHVRPVEKSKSMKLAFLLRGYTH